MFRQKQLNDRQIRFYLSQNLKEQYLINPIMEHVEAINEEIDKQYKIKKQNYAN